MYSTVNRAVKNHSSNVNSRCQRSDTLGMLSVITTAALSRMSTISAMSKARPARVSVPKMTAESRSRQGARACGCVGETMVGRAIAVVRCPDCHARQKTRCSLTIMAVSYTHLTLPTTPYV